MYLTVTSWALRRLQIWTVKDRVALPLSRLGLGLLLLPVILLPWGSGRWFGASLPRVRCLSFHPPPASRLPGNLEPGRLTGEVTRR